MRLPSARVARLRLDLAPSRFVVLCAGPAVGPIAPRDGIDTVILACAMLQQRHGVDTMLIVIGGERSGRRDDKGDDKRDDEGDDERGDKGDDERGGDSGNDTELTRLRQLARELGVGRAIRFAACQPHTFLDHCHAAADVFASTPWHPSPAAASAVARAMSCALPVVGTAGGTAVDATVSTAIGTAACAITATVRDGVTGYLVPPRDPENLCQCLARLQRQPLLARAMGMAGQAHVSATSH
ncbi:glycosyltransferase [Massilia sp. HP4]|uniref:glycosyltransferase n=1 Tax=Massilia sp. HP4 TaxID=2562316 RepID=UPI0010C00230|nr:glycosyltransferase [Massilia sp. HP4]